MKKILISFIIFATTIINQQNFVYANLNKAYDDAVIGAYKPKVLTRTEYNFNIKNTPLLNQIKNTQKTDSKDYIGKDDTIYDTSGQVSWNTSRIILFLPIRVFYDIFIFAKPTKIDDVFPR